MSSAPIPALIDTIDSFYEFVLANVHVLNPARVFGGIVEARDWPPKSLVPAAPYLAILRDTPTRTKPQSFYAPLMTDIVEWRWALMGDNIPQNAQAANRGDKYRLNVQIMQELLSAHNPGYAMKSQWGVTNDVNNNAIKVSTPYNPPEPFWWSIPEFTRKQDRQSGMVYTAATVQVSSYAPVSGNLG